MDCRTCQPSLLDLAEGQLATDAAVEARAHLRECASCRSAFDKLEAGLGFARQLELLTPPDAVRERVMRMAEVAALRVRTQNAPKPVPPRGPLRVVLDFMRGFAMARQVGMATIFLLIVAVGLWSLPQLRHRPAAVGTTVVNSGPSDLQPAGMPTDDLRVASQDRATEQHSPQPAAAPVMAAKPAPAREALREMTTARAARHQASGAIEAAKDKTASLRLKEPEPSREAAVATARPARGSPPQDDLPGGAEKKEGPRAFPASDVPQRAPSAQVAAAAAPKATHPTDPAPRAVGDLMLDAYGDRASPSATSAQGSPPSGSGQALGGASLARSRSGGTPTAAPALAAAPAQPVPERGSALSLAGQRALAAQRGCEAALPGYAQLVRLAPESPDAGEALIDMARCQRSLGRNDAARGLLARAARIASAAARARALLSELDRALPGEKPAKADPP